MISLVITVKNELTNIKEWFQSIQKQKKNPDEIIVVDGMSTDGTWEWLQSIASQNIRVFQKEGNIATGRNYAITQARGEIIVVTDAGCIYGETWLKEIVEPLEKDDLKASTTAFKPWFKKTDNLIQYLIAAATIPREREFKKSWLPSSRSFACVKSLWTDVGGYPEWIPYCEDVIFDITIQKKGVEIAHVENTLVAWRPRHTLGAFMRQLYNYTRSDAHGKLFYERQIVRFCVYIGLLGLIYGMVYYPLLFGLILMVCGAIYMKKFWFRFFEFGKPLPSMIRVFGYMLLIPVIAVGDIAKMCGWIVGIGERWSGKIKYHHY